MFCRYNLLKIIQCYGEVENFEYLFHTVGPHKGEPRTYCFVEYKRKEVSIERKNLIRVQESIGLLIHNFHYQINMLYFL